MHWRGGGAFDDGHFFGHFPPFEAVDAIGVLHHLDVLFLECFLKRHAVEVGEFFGVFVFAETLELRESIFDGDVGADDTRVLLSHVVVEKSHDGVFALDGKFGSLLDVGGDGDGLEFDGAGGVFWVTGQFFEEEVQLVEALGHHGVAPRVESLFLEVGVVLENPHFLSQVGHRCNHLRWVAHPAGVVWQHAASVHEGWVSIVQLGSLVGDDPQLASV